MLHYPLYLDENISRPIALTVFTTAFVTLLRPEYSWMMYFIFGDFILRYIHPKFSPITFSARIIGLNVLQNQSNLKFAPPKRFAILVGIGFSGVITLSIYFTLQTLQVIFTIGLMFAAFLQGFYGYCVGCKIYDYLIRIGIINPNKSINGNLSNPVNIR